MVSSLCRSCGDHFRVRKGIAQSSPGIRISGIVEQADALREPGPTAAPASDAAPGEDQGDIGASWLFAAVGAESPANGAPDRDDRDNRDADSVEPRVSAGEFFGLAGNDAPESRSGADSPRLGRQARSRRFLGEGTMAAMIAGGAAGSHPDPETTPPFLPSEADRKREENAIERLVRCFHCHRIQEVPRRAKSSQCDRCSTYISLEDYEIRTPGRQRLHTRGDITISKRGGLVEGSDIACHHLTVNGAIDAAVDCSGDAVFRHSGTVRGRLHCDRLVLERGCEVIFPDGVAARSAEISGHLVGDLTCSGKVRLGRSGLVDGRLTALDLEQKEGGQVTGDTRIELMTGTASPTLETGFDPALIR